jgi:hypothetical protein
MVTIELQNELVLDHLSLSCKWSHQHIVQVDRLPACLQATPVLSLSTNSELLISLILILSSCEFVDCYFLWIKWSIHMDCCSVLSYYIFLCVTCREGSMEAMHDLREVMQTCSTLCARGLRLKLLSKAERDFFLKKTRQEENWQSIVILFYFSLCWWKW